MEFLPAYPRLLISVLGLNLGVAKLDVPASIHRNTLSVTSSNTTKHTKPNTLGTNTHTLHALHIHALRKQHTDAIHH